MKPHHSHKQSEDPAHCLYQAIAAIKTTEEAKHFLNDLCTPNEIEAMSDRWRVVDLIKIGKPYRKIHDETGVSTTTIGRVARFIELGANGYNLIYERLEKKLNESRNKIKNRNTKIRASQ